MKRMERALDRVGLPREDVQRVLRTTQSEAVATPWMEVGDLHVQVTSPRECVRLRIDEDEVVNFDAAGARRLGICLLLAAAYIETEPPTAEETLASVERILGTSASASDRVVEVRNVIDEWRSDR